MKARGKYRRFFRKGRQVQPNIQRITPERFTDDEVTELNDLYHVTFDTDTWNTYQNADTYGSLIQPPTELAALASAPSDEGAVERMRDWGRDPYFAAPLAFIVSPSGALRHLPRQREALKCRVRITPPDPACPDAFSATDGAGPAR